MAVQGPPKNAIYSYQCKEVDCDEDYIGETSITLRERYREHLKEPSPIHAHSIQIGHSANKDNFNFLGREDWSLTRLIKESIYIRVNNPTLKRNIGKFNLSHIWDRVLFNTPDLKLSSNKGQVQIHSNRQSPQPIPPMGQPQGQSEHTLNSGHVLRGFEVHISHSNARFVLRPDEVTVVNESLSIYKPNVLYLELFNYINALPTE